MTFKSRQRAILRACAIMAGLFSQVSMKAGVAESITFPANSGVLNVTSYGAVPNDSGDDTAAIQAALTAANRNQKIVYLPNGTYIVSDTLKWSHGGSYNEGWGAWAQMQGQSRAGTIIKLKDGAPGFNDTSDWTKRKPVIKSASDDTWNNYLNGEGNEAFENHIRNLTVDVGSGNAGAIGIYYQASNTGALRDVTIKSSDAQKRGSVGLALYGRDNGPALVKNVSIDGFNTGIDVAGELNTFTLENITLTNQISIGIWQAHAILSIRNLQSTNSVPVIRVLGNGLLNLIGANLTGGSANNRAIWLSDSEARAYVRDVTTSGYSNAVDNRGTLVPGTSVTDWSSDGVKTLFTSLQTSLRLPIEETPTYYNENHADWASVVAHGATVNSESNDDASGIQSALNSGKPVIYFPAGRYHVGSTITVPSHVRLIVGCTATIVAKTVLTPIFKVSGGNSGHTTIFDNMQWSGDGTLCIRQEDTRTVVLRDINTFGTRMYNNTVSGPKLFIEDVASGGYTFDHPLRVWARQWNAEGYGNPKILNKGGTLWCLGWKTEGGETLLENRNGGKVELFGGFAYSFGVNTNTPLILNDNSSLVASIANVSYNSGPYDLLVREVRGTETRDLRRANAAYRAGGSVVQLYTGYVQQTNLISNPSFDAENYDTQTPSGWAEWSNGNYDAGYTESYGGSASGARHGTHWKGVAYQMYTYQLKTGLANGLYTARLKARSSGGQASCVFSVKLFGASDIYVNIPVSSTYQTVEVQNVNVTNGQCEIGIWSDASANQWCSFDDVEFFKQ